MKRYLLIYSSEGSTPVTIQAGVRVTNLVLAGKLFTSLSGDGRKQVSRSESSIIHSCTLRFTFFTVNLPISATYIITLPPPFPNFLFFFLPHCFLKGENSQQTSWPPFLYIYNQGVFAVISPECGDHSSYL